MCVCIGYSVIKKRHPATFPNVSHTPVCLQQGVTDFVILWSHNGLDHDTSPCSLGGLDIIVMYIVISLLYQAAILAVQGMLEAEIITTAVTSSWKKHGHMMVL